MTERMNRGVILLLAVTCGVAVGNVYFPAAISPVVAGGLNISHDSAALVVTATQFGYAAGIFLLVPLGDRFPHRPLIVTLLGVSGFALLAAGLAPSLPPLLGASALVGLATVVAPIIGPMAAGQVAEDRRGVVSGTLLSGSIGGILLSRALGGTISEWLGWRAPYLMAAAVALVMAVVLARVLPLSTPPSAQRYPALLLESLRLLRTEPALRRSCFYQAMVFGGFSAVWTCVALLITSTTYGLGAQEVGMLALVNVATMLCTPMAGRLVDRRGPDRVNLVCMLVVLVAAGVLAFGGLGGVLGFAALVVGTLLLDVGMQSGMVANSVRIYGLDRDLFSRLNTAYMTCAYLGGSFGSWIGVRAYTAFGWSGVCVLLALLTTAALVRHGLLAADQGKVADDRVVAEVAEAGPVGEVGRLDRATGPVGAAAVGGAGE